MQLSCGDKAKGADDLLPMFIYTVLRANPPFFYSNMQYISNYSPSYQLTQGEGAYYYTLLYRLPRHTLTLTNILSVNQTL